MDPGFGIINYAALGGKLLLFLINAVGLELILWIYVANRYSRPSRIFLFGALFVIFWADIDFISGLAPLLLPQEMVASASLWATRAMYALLAEFFALFYIFSTNFPVKIPKPGKYGLQSLLNKVIWGVLGVVAFTPLIVRDISFDQLQPLGVLIRPGELFWPYAIFAVASLAYSIVTLHRGYRSAEPKLVASFKHIIWGIGIFGVFNLLFNVLLPVIGGVFRYVDIVATFIGYVIVAYLGFGAYEAIKEKLFGIKVILVEIFVGLMGASLFAMTFFVAFLWQQVLLGILFMLFCVFSYILVKSIIKEYREKELLEQKVLERTKELVRAKQNLEEMNLVLEIRVKARTRELKNLNQTLEAKIKERTRDLEKKIVDMEKFQQITIGRELKMIELKGEISRLRAQIEGK